MTSTCCVKKKKRTKRCERILFHHLILWVNETVRYGTVTLVLKKRADFSSGGAVWCHASFLDLTGQPSHSPEQYANKLEFSFLCFKE